MDVELTGEVVPVEPLSVGETPAPCVLPSDIAVLAQAVKSRQLRVEYQRPDYDNIELAFDRVRRVLYVAFMGSGKMVVAAALIRVWASRGEKILIVCPTREILRQTDRKLISAGLTKDQIGWIWQRGIDRFRGRNGKWVSEPREKADAPIQLASLDTLRRRDMPKGVTRIVLDEAHHAPAPKWRKVIDRYPEAWVLGLTGTPRHRNRPLVGGPDACFDEMVQCHLSTEQLIAGGFIDRPTFWTPEWSAPLTRWAGRDFTPKEAAKLMRGPFVLGTMTDEFVKHGVTPALGFAATRKKAAQYAKAFDGLKKGDRTYRAETLFGDDLDGVRQDKLDRLARGRLDVLWTCDVLSEGWDYDGLRCVMLARPTLSLVRYLQQVGRCMRPGLPPPVILDLWGAWKVYDPPWADFDWASSDWQKRQGRGRRYVGSRGDAGSLTWEAAGRLVRADTTHRQVICAGRGDYDIGIKSYKTVCPSAKKTPAHAFQSQAVARRRGRPWRCLACAMFKPIKPLPQDVCAGRGLYDVVSKTYASACPLGSKSTRLCFTKVVVKSRKGRPWRCRDCANAAKKFPDKKCDFDGCRNPAKYASVARWRQRGGKVYCDAHPWGYPLDYSIGVCDWPGCKRTAARRSFVAARNSGGNAYCEIHKFGPVAPKPKRTCDKPGCRLSATESSAYYSSQSGRPAYCEKHKRRPRKLKRCARRGCGLLATRHSSNSSYRTGIKAYCEKHKGGGNAPAHLPRCHWPGCENLAARKSASHMRMGRTKHAYCENHKMGPLAKRPLLRCFYKSNGVRCPESSTKNSSNNARAGGGRAYCVRHRCGVDHWDKL